MNKIICREIYNDINKKITGLFIIEPLNIGQGITLGNMLRRIILNNLSEYKVSGLRINNINNEFSIIRW